MSTAVKVRPLKPTSKAPRIVESDHPLRIIRDPEFAKRFDQACDGYPMVPPKHSGRLTWIQRELVSRFNEKVSVETVRKWFTGEAKPRPEKLAMLAQMLQVDVAWLSLGVDPDLQPRERRARNAMADGAVNLVAGLIQMDGGYPAFPEETGKSAQRNHVDLHAIIKGAKYDFHVSLGATEGKRIRFVVPVSCADVVVLGVIKNGFAIEIVELTPEMIEAGERRGGSVEVFVERDAKLKRIETFQVRL